MMPSDFPAQPVTGIRPSEAELAARRARNRAIGVLLVGLAGLFYVMTLAKLGLHLPFGS
jgi:hypothetical protein